MPFLFYALVIGIIFETPLAIGGKTLDLYVFEAGFPDMSTFEGLGGLLMLKHVYERGQ